MLDRAALPNTRAFDRAVVAKFELASYRSMLGAAEELGMSDLQQMCERFIRVEQEMAQFLFDQLPTITREYLRRGSAQ